MMKYPKDYLEEIKLRLKVSQVVGKTVQLKRRGKEFVGLSPFKNEKTPSFTVSDEKGFYHCFSTGEHGNIFDFLMKTQSLGFGESVKKLAAEAGLPPYKFTKFDEKKNKRYDNYKLILKNYLNLCQENLLNKKNNFALNYLLKRGISKKTVFDFKLGYVSNNDEFYKILSQNFKTDELDSSGLFYKHEKSNNYVGRFKSRIIYPINNLSGEVIAFGGRIIGNEKLAKYINSPETEFYKKGNILFNLDKAKEQRSQTNEVIVVEGYMDVLSLYENGIFNVISNSGTAFTENQIELLWKFFPNANFCLDGDNSGQNAAKRISERIFPLISDNKKIFFTILNNSQDPDDFVKKNGKEKFLDLLNQKISIEDFIWKTKFQNVNNKSPYEISKFEKEIRKICNSINDVVLKKHILEVYLNKLSSLTPRQKSNFKYKKNLYDVKILSETREIHKKKQNLSAEKIKEFSILYIMISYPKIIKSYFTEKLDMKFNSNNNENLRKSLLSAILKNDDVNLFDKVLSDNKDLIEELKSSVNIKSILKSKSDLQIFEILNELMTELKNISQSKKLESFEKKLLNNFDENSYSELLKLKSQLNGE